ncbi:MAG: DUF4197 domain-containing protein [Kiloniellales bacterium]|nr:DUF4197 domain-containing protein [Kiloniellales bacterium]
MRMLATSAALICLSFTLPAQADERSAANRLLVEATALIADAAALDRADARSKAYSEALALLERIIERHPGSDVAVRLATGQPIGSLHLPLLRSQAALATLEAKQVSGGDAVARAERLAAAAEALKAKNRQLQEALTLEENQVTALLMEQVKLRGQVGTRVPKPGIAQMVERPQELRTTLARVKELEAENGALRAQNADLTATLSVEREATQALRFELERLTLDAATASAGSVSVESTALAPAAGTETTSAAPSGTGSGGGKAATQQAALTAEPASEAEAPKISPEEIAEAIREALQLGTDRVVQRIGRIDGFYADPQIRIPLPENLRPVGDALSAMGLGAFSEDLEMRLNRAAESAAPQAQQIFAEAITQMGLEDIEGIFNGPEDAATRYFQKAMSAPLSEAMRPVIDQSLADVGALQAYDDLIGKYKTIPLVPDVKADLSAHVLMGALDGLFHYLGQEEAAIRSDSIKRTTELLQRVFGSRG